MKHRQLLATVTVTVTALATASGKKPEAE